MLESVKELTRMLGQVAGSCECGNEPSGSIERWEFLDWLTIC
jgi:hypothetical protein